MVIETVTKQKLLINDLSHAAKTKYQNASINNFTIRAWQPANVERTRSTVDPWYNYCPCQGFSVFPCTKTVWLQVGGAKTIDSSTTSLNRLWAVTVPTVFRNSLFCSAHYSIKTGDWKAASYSMSRNKHYNHKNRSKNELRDESWFNIKQSSSLTLSTDSKPQIYNNLISESSCPFRFLIASEETRRE